MLSRKSLVRTIDVGKTVPTSEGDLDILSNVSVEIGDGESVAIVGASGSGKTTLLTMMAGLDTPTRGEVYLGDNLITAMSEEQRAQVRSEMVGFVFQSFHLLSTLTALENVMLPAELKKDRDAADKATDLLDRVGLSERLHHYPRQLSGGEQQRVALARAFASSVRVLFADEPTGNLDTATGERLIDQMFDLNAAFGTTLILVTHDQRLAERCDRKLAMASGTIVAPDQAPALKA